MVDRLSFMDEIFGRARAIMTMKNHDYANDTDVFSNLRECEKQGVSAWRGALVRCSDKYSRENEFAKKGVYMVKDENFVNTLLDHINYLAITIKLYEEEQANVNAERANREPDPTGDELGRGDVTDGSTYVGDPPVPLSVAQALKGRDA